MTLIDKEALLEKLSTFHPDYTFNITSFRNFIKAQPEVEKKGKWIPCSERLPKEGKEVLISTEGGSLYIGVLELIDDYFAYWYESQEYMTIKGVSAWMPLPEPYKGEGNG